MSSDSTELEIRWDRRAIKEAAQLPRTDRQRVFSAVEGLRQNPLQGTLLHTDWKGFRRLRVGSYHIIYAFDGRELMISVVRVGHRREVYR